VWARSRDDRCPCAGWNARRGRNWAVNGELTSGAKARRPDEGNRAGADLLLAFGVRSTTRDGQRGQVLRTWQMFTLTLTLRDQQKQPANLPIVSDIQTRWAAGDIIKERRIEKRFHGWTNKSRLEGADRLRLSLTDEVAHSNT